MLKAIDLFINKEIGKKTLILIYNLPILYFLAVLILGLSDRQVSFVTASFVASSSAFAGFNFVTNYVNGSRFFYGSFNPNDVAVMGLLSLAFTYVSSLTFTNRNFFGVFRTVIKVIIILSAIINILLTPVTGARFATMA